MATTKTPAKIEAKAVVKATAPVTKPELVIVPADGIANALLPNPIDESEKRRALALVRHTATCPNHGIIRRKLEGLDQRAVAWAIEECRRLDETQLYYVAKTSQYDLSVLAVASKAPEVPAAAIPPSAAALVRKPGG